MSRKGFSSCFRPIVAGALALSYSPAWGLAIGVDFDAAFPNAAKEAFFHAKDAIWEPLLLPSYSGEQVMIQAKWESSSKSWLAATDSHLVKNFGSSDPDYKDDTYYTSALANHLKMADADASVYYDMTITFDGTDPWYYGADGKASGTQYDFVTIAAHEIAHGLGFWENVEKGGTFWNGSPSIYDLFLEGDNGHGEVEPLPMMDGQERAFAITSGDLYWNGAHGVAANGGSLISLYAPSTYVLGSSVSHLDPGAFPLDLMKPAFPKKQAIHSPSGQDLGMLADMGWDLVPEPGTFVLLFTGIAALAARCRLGRVRGGIDTPAKSAASSSCE